MPGPYPQALRERVVAAYKKEEGTFEELAQRFSVGIATVNRWLSLYRRQGNTVPQAMGGDRRSLVTDEMKSYLRHLLSDEATWTANELSEEIEEAFGKTISPRTLTRALHGMNYSFKRGSFVREL